MKPINTGKGLNSSNKYKNLTIHLKTIPESSLNMSSPLAISMKLVLFSAGYLCFWRGESLMKLACSGAHFSGLRGPARGRERGRNQNGMAASRVMTPAMR